MILNPSSPEEAFVPNPYIAEEMPATKTPSSESDNDANPPTAENTVTRSPGRDVSSTSAYGFNPTRSDARLSSFLPT